MPFPSVAVDEETFFEPTRIWLFGKPFPALIYDRGSMVDEFTDYHSPDQDPDLPQPPAGLNHLPMPPRRIERTLRRRPSGQDPIFARIYSFSFEGHYYKLPRPLLFLVYAQGQPVGGAAQAHNQAAAQGSFSPEDPFSQNRSALYTKFGGIEARDWTFSRDIQVWQVDKKDLAVCLDIEIGNYGEILLDSMIAFQEDMASRGSLTGRGSVAARGSAASRGSASFRGSMVGPHQDRDR